MGRVITGIVVVALGIGITLASYQLAQPGGIYVVPVGLIAGGFLIMSRGIATPSATSRKLRSHARPARARLAGFRAPPGQMPWGYCWQCGRKVRAENAICLGCGATQVHTPTTRSSGEGASPNSWDFVASAPPGASPWAPQAPAPKPTVPDENRDAPIYQPGSWNPWDDPAHPPMPPGRTGPRYPR